MLVSLRQLLLTAAVLCLFCIPCFAGEWSVSLGMNGGDADTITGDLSLRYTLNPFYGNGAGIRFGESYRHDVQVDVAHFSNAGLNNHNSGFNTYGVSYGFRF